VIHYLDTQVMVWLCEGQVGRLSKAAVAGIEESDLVISPIVMLELEYLYEIKRIVKPPLALLNQLQIQIGLRINDYSFSAVIHTALFETWTKDPFDRVIVAHARSDGQVPLVTSDTKIRKNYSNTVW
jgi:PIN domain nuclease of toxin-antitoxin system